MAKTPSAAVVVLDEEDEGDGFEVAEVVSGEVGVPVTVRVTAGADAGSPDRAEQPVVASRAAAAAKASPARPRVLAGPVWRLSVCMVCPPRRYGVPGIATVIVI
ncbi:MAG: hypothetical protein U0Q14_07830 [Dermatophilaceae bacterium]